MDHNVLFARREKVYALERELLRLCHQDGDGVHLWFSSLGRLEVSI
jgi:hypothetical protein